MKAVDPIEHIEKHPEMYLPFGRVTGPGLMTLIVSDAIMTAAQVTSLRREDWWIVASETDWIAPYVSTTIEDFFRSIVPFSDAGPNSMHSAPVLTAFARDVITAGRDDLALIKGSLPASDSIRSFVRSNPDWTRVVAFRVETNRSPSVRD